MDAATEQLDFRKHRDELAASWQVRALLGQLEVTVQKPYGQIEPVPLSLVMLSVLAHNYDDAMPVLLKVADMKVEPPFLCTAGKISKGGMVYAQVVTPTLLQNGQRLIEPWGLFPNTGFMEAYFRKLADLLKLNDTDRVEMFKAVQRWIVCDFRIDPTMDPKDPDAKRTRH